MRVEHELLSMLMGHAMGTPVDDTTPPRKHSTRNKRFTTDVGSVYDGLRWVLFSNR